jgi:hypothetical protein
MSLPESLLSNRLSNLLEFTELDVPQEPLIPPEQKENIKTLITDLQASVDQPPSQESLIQLTTTVQESLADKQLDVEEVQAIAAATYDVFDSMGLTKAELRTLAYDLQDIAEDSKLPSEDQEILGTDGSDLLLGGLGADTLIGMPTDGKSEVDMLVGGGGADIFVLGTAETIFYKDENPFTMGMNDYGLMVDFNLAQDTIQLHGSAADYSLGALPQDLPLTGTAIYHTAVGAMPELVGVIAGVEVTNFNQGFECV